MHSRFPQFATSAYDLFTYNPEGGILHASTCLRTLRDLVLDMGGEIIEGCRVTHLEHESQRRPLKLHTSTGQVIAADRVVIGAGPWVHRLLAGYDLPVRMTRQYLLYFAGLPLSLFKAGRFPAFLADHLYGFPIHRGCHGWVKAASHDPGALISPDEISTPDQDILARTKEQLFALLPMLRSAQIARVDSCIYDNSPDGDFILDTLPGDPRVVIATGLSGHGFKFGLLLGELLSSIVRETAPIIPIERFGLARFSRLRALQAHSVA